MNTCGARVKLDLGRVVVFLTTDFSFHGHPHPLTAPEGRVRRSIALYYYTNGLPKNECINDECATYSKDREKVFHNHGTYWKTPKCVHCLDCFSTNGDFA